MASIREAAPGDAEALARLIGELGFGVEAADLPARLLRLEQAGTPALVALAEEEVVGCLTWNVMPVLHRTSEVGRISMLIVTADCRSRGVGSKLVEAAEQRMIERSCRLVEVTSNHRLVDAHLFYERLGYRRTSHRFAKTLETKGG